MADAKLCDRCGDYYPASDDADRDLFITDRTAVAISVSESDVKPSPPSPPGTGLAVGRSTTVSESVETKDLCSDCQEEFEAFWEGSA
jgi:hypothetical protein